MTMDYSPWSEREIWSFLKVAISLKPETPCPSKLVYMHLTSIPTCINFLSQFQSIQFFSLPWTIVHGLKRKLAKSEKEQRRGGVMIIVVFDFFLMQLDSKGSVSGSYS